MEVCVGRHCCYDKEIPWHRDDATNGLLAPLTGRGVVPSGQPLVLWVLIVIPNHREEKPTQNSDMLFFYMFWGITIVLMLTSP